MVVEEACCALVDAEADEQILLVEEKAQYISQHIMNNGDARTGMEMPKTAHTRALGGQGG